jgi:hypothetical protein
MWQLGIQTARHFQKYSFDDGINGPNIFTRVQAHLEFIQNHTRVSSPADCSSTTNGTEPTTTTGPTTSTTQKITTTSTEKTTNPTTTTSTTNRPVTFSCAGKANGNYPNPSSSSCSNTFYTCSNSNAYLFVSYPTLKSKISGSNSSFRCRTALLIWFIGRKLASAIILPTWPDAIKN